ncbi:hypothetical protein IBX65_03350 [Candidatus Aerophobetes bacterium]|nr:hypothetical protein [Candidatus Aerophobetes bacterium]
MARISSNAQKNIAERPDLSQISTDGNIGRGRRKKLYEMFYQHGPGRGTFLGLPFDQRVEHGAGHVAKWERSAEPDAVIELANKAGVSALVLPLRTAAKYQSLICPWVPLIVKLDGHFRVASNEEVSYPRHACYGDSRMMIYTALEMGATAVGLTFYIGGEETMEDVERIGEIVEEAHDASLPVVIWAYARGPLPERVGADSLYWCHNAVAAAEDLGADVVKTKFPRPARNIDAYKDMLQNFVKAKMPEAPEMYLDLEPENEHSISYELHVRRMNLVVGPARRTFVVVSGGPKLGKDPEKELEETTRIVMDAGAEGRIIGRNFWGRPTEEAQRLIQVVTNVMQDARYDREKRNSRK